jgi:hypothetical protein
LVRVKEKIPLCQGGRRHRGITTENFYLGFRNISADCITNKNKIKMIDTIPRNVRLKHNDSITLMVNSNKQQDLINNPKVLIIIYFHYIRHLLTISGIIFLHFGHSGILIIGFVRTRV